MLTELLYSENITDDYMRCTARSIVAAVLWPRFRVAAMMWPCSRVRAVVWPWVRAVGLVAVPWP